MAQQHEQPSPQPAGNELRTQRMTAAESRAVIDLWQQERVEQTGLTDCPAVPDVAEGLDITVEDVQRLLQEVRARREEEARLLVQEQALAEIHLAEEQRQLAEIQRQRAALSLQQKPRQLVPRSEWVEVKPGIWEDAGLPGYSYADFNQLSPNPQGAGWKVQPSAARLGPWTRTEGSVWNISNTVALEVAALNKNPHADVSAFQQRVIRMTGIAKIILSVVFVRRYRL